MSKDLVLGAIHELQADRNAAWRAVEAFDAQREAVLRANKLMRTRITILKATVALLNAQLRKLRTELRRKR